MPLFLQVGVVQGEAPLRPLFSLFSPVLPDRSTTWGCVDFLYLARFIFIQAGRPGLLLRVSLLVGCVSLGAGALGSVVDLCSFQCSL